MPPRTIVFGLVTFLHDLFTAVWIGGLLVLGLTVLPVGRQHFGRGPETKRLMAAIQARHSIFVYISITGLVLTGLLLSRRSPNFGGLFSFENPYATMLSIKHVAVLLMIVITLLRSVWLGRADSHADPAREKRSMALLLANLVLGVVVLLLSGILAALV